MSEQIQMVESEYYSPKQLAAKVNMKIKWVEKYTQARLIPGQIKMGGAWRYEKRAVHHALSTGQFLLKKAPPNADH